MCKEQVHLDDLAQKTLPEHIVRSIESLEIVENERNDPREASTNYAFAYFSLDRPSIRFQIAGKRAIALIIAVVTAIVAPGAIKPILEIVKLVLNGHV